MEKGGAWRLPIKKHHKKTPHNTDIMRCSNVLVGTIGLEPTTPTMSR